jgi:hemolysin III
LPAGINRWIKEPYCGLSHAFGAVLALAGLVVLLVIAGGGPWQRAGFAVYGTSMVLLFTASALTHSLHCSARTGSWLDQFDYCAIFLLIAGSYTPICLGPLRGPWGWTLLGLEWGLAAAGIASTLVLRERAAWVRLSLYIVMGWLAFVAIGPLARALPPAALAWLVGGGVVYTVGAVVFATERPRLWPGRFGSHDLWHTLVLLGAGCHFVAIARYMTGDA